MKTKKILKVSIGLVAAVVLLVAVIFVSSIFGSEIADGTYEITNSSQYPDAYVVVKDNEIQFYNIDLNELYREKELEDFEVWKEMGYADGMTDEQIAQISDLNLMFVDNAWEFDYDMGIISKNGTFTYVYFCIVKDTCFGLVLQYDSLHKTIQINDADEEKVLVFDKVWFK